MKKIVMVILTVCLLCAATALYPGTDSLAAEEGKSVAFPGGNLSMWNQSGVWLSGASLFAQAFHVSQPIRGFVMTAWLSAGNSVLYYSLCQYHTDVETSVDEDDFITEGTVEFEEDNPLNLEVLFEEEVPAGQYVLVLRAESGIIGLNIVKGKTEATDFWCTEGIQLVDNYGMNFDPSEGDPSVMAGGLIFSSGDADASAYLPIEAVPEEKPTEKPAEETETPATENPATEAPATEAPATEAPATEVPAEKTQAATEKPASGTPEKEEGGCGSVLSGGGGVLLAVAAAVLAGRKKTGRK